MHEGGETIKGRVDKLIFTFDYNIRNSLSLRNQTINGVKWTTISRSVQAISGLLKVSILARFLDKSDFGLMALVLFVLGFMQLFMDMGLSTAILHKQEISKKEYASLFWVNFGISIILFGLVYLLASPIAKFYDEPMLRELVPIMGISLILSAIGRQFKTIEQKQLNFKLMAVITIFGSLCALTVAIILAINNYGVYALVLGTLAQHFITNICYFFRGIRKNGLAIHLNLKEVKPFLAIGGYYVGGQVINYFNRDLDILLVGKIFGADILGGYSLAKELVFRPSKIINPVFNQVASPILAKLQANLNELRDNYLKLVNIVSTVNTPIYFILIIFAPLVVKLVYGDGFTEIVPLVRILSVYMIFRAVGNPIGSLVIATGRTDLDFIWSLVALAILPVAVAIGSSYSIEAVALCLTLSMMVLFVPNWWFLVRKMINVELTTYIYWLIPGIYFLKQLNVNQRSADSG